MAQLLSVEVDRAKDASWGPVRREYGLLHLREHFDHPAPDSFAVLVGFRTEGKPGPVIEQSAESYAATFDTKVLGTLLSMKLELHVMLLNSEAASSMYPLFSVAPAWRGVGLPRQQARGRWPDQGRGARGSGMHASFITGTSIAVDGGKAAQ